MIGKAIIQTICKDPLLQRFGVVIKAAPFGYNDNRAAWEIMWQQSSSMPYGRPYSSTHSEDTLGDYELVGEV